jgi:hypothetical protein
VRRLNVRAAQLDACIEGARFALAAIPQHPKLYRGELLLLSLVAQDALTHGKRDHRVEWVLVFHHHEGDPDGRKSRRYWPHEGRTWLWILNCSEARRVVHPFSLENLGLSEDYSGQDNARLISPEDEKKILPYVNGRG